MMETNLEENINRAAKELPEDWIIEINVERGAGWVNLYDFQGNNTIWADGTLSDQVSDAIDYALKYCNS